MGRGVWLAEGRVEISMYREGCGYQGCLRSRRPKYGAEAAAAVAAAADMDSSRRSMQIKKREADGWLIVQPQRCRVWVGDDRAFGVW